MLDRTSYSCDVEVCEAPSSFASTGIRNLGLTNVNQGGMWALPAFCPEVPLEITLAELDVVNLATFQLLAHEMGLALPDSMFTTTAQAMTWQFAQYASGQVKNLKKQLPLHVELSVSDGTINLIASPQSDLDIYMLAGPVERLNAACAGLGWFLTDLLSKAHAFGLSTYDPCRIGDCMANVWFNGEETDAAFASSILGFGEDDVTDEEIEDAKQEQAFMPSAALKAFGGHKNLLQWSSSESELAATKPLSALQVREKLALLQLTQQDRELVVSALAFSLSIEDAALDSQVAPQGWLTTEDENGYGFEAIGALAFVVWDDADLALEAVAHYEEFAMNGDSICDHMVAIAVELDEPATWENFIKAFKLYIARYAAMSEFVGSLPIKE